MKGYRVILMISSFFFFYGVVNCYANARILLQSYLFRFTLFNQVPYYQILKGCLSIIYIYNMGGFR